MITKTSRASPDKRRKYDEVFKVGALHLASAESLCHLRPADSVSTYWHASQVSVRQLFQALRSALSK